MPSIPFQSYVEARAAPEAKAVNDFERQVVEWAGISISGAMEHTMDTECFLISRETHPAEVASPEWGISANDPVGAALQECTFGPLWSSPSVPHINAKGA